MGRSGRIAVIGSSGFVGSHVLSCGRSSGYDIEPVKMPRVNDLCAGTGSTDATAWRRSHPDAFTELCLALEPFEVVINAAGFAGPGSADLQNLLSANALLPAIVAQAAQSAGVRRLVHISTAAVQGRLDPLDETPRHFPLSPYADSKAVAERFLLDVDGSDHLPPEVIVYRATSVQGSNQSATRALARLATRLPAVPVSGAGEQAIPVALIENVAAGVLCAAVMPRPPAIILQPYEGLTTLRLLELFGARRIVHLPAQASNRALGLVGRMAARSTRLSSYLRWCELLVHGQAIQAHALASAGFHARAGYDAWSALARLTQESTVAMAHHRGAFSPRS